MAFFTARFRRKAKHALEAFLLFVIILAFAIALTYVVDWMRSTHRPAWLVWGVEGLSMFASAADGVMLVGVFIHAISITVRELWETR